MGPVPVLMIFIFQQCVWIMYRPIPCRPAKSVADGQSAYRYLHAVDGRDAEIAAALSALPNHGDAARLPKSIVTTIDAARGMHIVRPLPAWPCGDCRS